MKILCIDVGTGTQDILLHDTNLHPENDFKLVVPSPTMIVRRRLQAATRAGRPVLLTGVTMGGGPSHWAAEDHLKAGHKLYATPAAARSFNDDLNYLQTEGIQVVSEDEARKLPDNVLRLTLRDFDFDAICHAFAEFGVSLNDLAAVAVAVFDHGNAPPDVSDRKFRFEYIARRVQANRQLSTFAFAAEDIPPIMTRMQAVAASAENVDAPLLLMDTAPAAVAGALLDSNVSAGSPLLVANLGNLHTLAFRLGPEGIEGTFEHHTGMLDQAKLERLLRSLAAGTLRDEDVYQDHGHGALILEERPFFLPEDLSKADKLSALPCKADKLSALPCKADKLSALPCKADKLSALPFAGDGFGVTLTGPRRRMLAGSSLRPYFASPFGDMMMAGCFGLLTAVAAKFPQFADPIQASLAGETGRPPWEL